MFERTDIYLTDVEGIARRTGRDAFGATWTEFECDSLALEDSTECAICSQVISFGWLCLDGAETVCASHVEIVPAWLVDMFAAEIGEAIASHNRLASARVTIGRALCEIGARHKTGNYLGWTEPVPS